jgi:hypothetical protein
VACQLPHLSERGDERKWSIEWERSGLSGGRKEAD